MSCCLVWLHFRYWSWLQLSHDHMGGQKRKIVRRFIEGTQRDEGAAVPLADVVASSTKDGDDASEPLTKTTPGKADAKITAK